MDKLKMFNELECFKDIASLLEIKDGYLWKIINDYNNYEQLVIPKKNGESRVIYCPNYHLKSIQRKLADILNNAVKCSPNVHGFVKGKSFVTNAKRHVKQKWVLSIDLADFFPNISIKRVHNLFIKYFKFNKNISNVLARIVCHPDGFLPQGAPTSPVIANILAKSMDKSIYKNICSKHNVIYTRYADDLTFSSYKISPPNNIAKISGNVISLSEELTSIIESQGFIINENKTKYMINTDRQMVTGIVVNKKSNVTKKYIRKLRAILYQLLLNINDFNKAQFTFFQKNNVNKGDMFEILKGMVNHVAHVKGDDDKVFTKLALKYNEVLSSYQQKGFKTSATKVTTPMLNLNKYVNNTFILDGACEYNYFDTNFRDNIKEDKSYEVSNDNGFISFSINYGSGTCFYVKSIGLITNYHVISAFDRVSKRINKSLDNFKFECFTSINPKYKIEVIIDKLDKEKDIAILKIVNDYDCGHLEGYHYSSLEMKSGTKTRLIGFPNYRIGSEIRIKDGTIQSNKYSTIQGKKMFEINQTIHKGNSGGPVLNCKNDKVIGIATMGMDVPSMVIPMSDVLKLKNEYGLEKNEYIQLT